MGYTAAMSQIRSIPIFVVATVSALCVAFTADKLRHRFSFIILGVMVGTVGYGILLAMDRVSVGVRYAACFLITTGGYIAQPVTLVWLSNQVYTLYLRRCVLSRSNNKQMGGHYKRSIAAAIQVGIGNCGGIVASNVFIKTEAPTYPTGFGTALAFLILCAIMAVAMFFGLKYENRKRDRGGRDYRYAENVSDLDNLGDDHPEFRFTT
jgi:hypothetical protein